MTDTLTDGISSKTVGGRLKQDAQITAAIDSIVDRTRELSAEITDIRPANPELKTDYDQLLATAADGKGRALLYPYIGSGIGNGPLVELADGSVKWDMITGIGVHFLGHSHPGIVRASVEAGLEDTVKHGNLMSGNAAYEFADTLLTQARKNSKLNQIFVTTSGAMANESAVKVCYQKHAPASRVLAFKHCFMGRSVTMCQIGDSAGGRQGIPLTTQVDYMPFWNDVAVEKVGGPTAFID
ncbi:MAG: aminotransferase class III-fold pyridoxal phosphate-dependent enzyme, partial [Planctomycetota bacterium]